MARKNFPDVVADSVKKLLAQAHFELGAEAFDGDVTELLVKYIAAEIDFQEGNISSEEYDASRDFVVRKLTAILS